MDDLVKNYIMLKALDTNLGLGTTVRLLVHWILYTDSIRKLGTEKH